MGATIPREERRLGSNLGRRAADGVVSELSARLDMVAGSLSDIKGSLENVATRLTLIEHCEADINAQLEKTHGWRLMLLVWGVGVLVAASAYGGGILEWWLWK